MKVVLLFACLTLGETRDARLKRASGGKEISIEDAPYFVSLRLNGTHICGGALLSTRHVVTSADCVMEISEPLDELKVVTGTDKYNRMDDGHRIETITPHEGYSEEKSLYNIALITLSGHIESNEKQKGIALPNAASPHCKHATFTALQVRWSEHGKPGLQQMNAKIQPSKHTRDSDSRFYGRFKRPQFISKVDLGGPLECNNAIIGIVSEKLDTIQYAFYFINVVKFKTFIEKFIGNKTTPQSERPTVIKWAPKRPRV